MRSVERPAVGMLPFLAESYHEGTGGLAISTTTTAGSQHYVRQTTRPLAVSPTSFRSPRRHTPSFDRLRSQSIFRPRSVTSRNSPSRSPSVRNPTLRCPTSRSPSLGFPSYIPRGPVFLSGTALESSSNATGEESEGLVMEELEGSESEDEWDETYVHEPRGRPQAPKPGLSAARPKPSTSRVSHK
ncbi:hypothetical protein FKP32DRAFT_663533 [Trametes sanguinea]|nr:hypothetical protein FKP32DRAFT_663533 [Trametes sanguinea]